MSLNGPALKAKSIISYFAIRTENVLYPTRCTYATLNVTNGRQRETPSNDVNYLGEFRDLAEIQRIFFFFFLKGKKKRLKVMTLSDVLQSTLLLRPCPISCFEDSRFASAAAFRCFSASFALRTKTPDIKYGCSSHFIQLHACNSLIAPYSTLSLLLERCMIEQLES